MYHTVDPVRESFSRKAKKKIFFLFASVGFRDIFEEMAV
jgi:hypothetical protein